MNQPFLVSVFVFLVAACVVVPLVGRLKLGSVLGYLIAGVLIGPYGAGLIHNPDEILELAEFGVIMMLFIIGLELDVETLWRLRMKIVGLGGIQVIVTMAIVTGIGMALGYDWRMSLAGGMALSLSSTALVLQMLEEKDLRQTSAGESSFAVLLFQDIAVIPILIVIPLLSNHSGPAAAAHANLVSTFPAWLHALVVSLVIAFVVLGGHFFARDVFRYIARTRLREMFTAISLALVVGITLLMEAIGVSPALGAFVAGMVLAHSEYRQTLETDIEPFKGLLLGLFFISIGMGMNFSLLAAHPGGIAGSVALLVLVKMAVLFGASRLFGLRGAQGLVFTFALSQGGEFAFVLFEYMHGLDLLNAAQMGLMNLIVAISMATTPFLMMLNDHFLVPRFMSRLGRDYDRIDAKGTPVIIAGYGRFGQIVGRFMKAQGIGITILEIDPDHIETLRKFGTSGYFGDASRLDLLSSAGAATAKLLVVAVDDADKCLEIVQMAKANFPDLKVFARARNRRHAFELHKAGVDYFRRELFDSSLTMAQEAMVAMGADAGEMAYKAEQFRRHDEETLRQSFEFFDREPELISFARQAAGEMQRILQEDIKPAVTRTG